MAFIQKYQIIIASILAAFLMVSISFIYSFGQKNADERRVTGNGSRLEFEEIVTSEEGVVLPVTWDDLGKRLVESGVIDKNKIESLYAERGGLSAEDKKILYGISNGKLIMNRDNAGFILNLLWGLGLGNKNEILEKGPMSDPSYGGAGRFASTGGWILASDNAMNHYSKHRFIALTDTQQEMAVRVAKNIYRPCCGNSTYFPDCNHGMAMLGLLELMASQGISETDMYKAALAVNSYWFPDTYVTIARYFNVKKISWNAVDPKEVLGNSFSSASGFQRIAAEVDPDSVSGGGSCSA